MSSRGTKHQRDQPQHGVNTSEIVKAQISNLKCTQLPKNQISKKLYLKISSVGDQVPFTTPTARGDPAVSWVDTYTFEAPISSSLEFQVCQHRNFHKDKIIGTLQRTVQSLLEETSSDIRCELWKAGAGGALEKLPTAITFSLSKLAQDADIGRLGEEEALSQAQGGLNQMASPSVIGTVIRAEGIAAQAVDAGESLGSIWESVLNKLEIFTEITQVISEVHPYAQTACWVLSAVPKALIAQRNRDDSVYCLMKAIDDMHSFVVDAEPLKKVESHRKMMHNMSRLTMESAYFIRDYTLTINFWKRFAKFSVSEVDAKIKEFNDQFDKLKIDFGRQMDITIYRCLKDVESGIAQIISLEGMLYAPGASYDPDKSCIPGTRSAILADLHDWINKPDVAADGSDTARIMVLAGVAGCGKSAIAHTVAQYYHKTKRLGSSFCFSQADRAARGPGNVLSTIAKDIADLDPQWKLSLYHAIQNDEPLRKTTATARQMQDLILGPAENAPITGPIVIVIDALDESGDTSARRALLQVLSKSASELPGNFRIIATTRPELDIIKSFKEKPCVEIRYVDAMDEAATDLDIAKFLRNELAEIAEILEEHWPGGEWIRLLVVASGHHFQWAATACRAIRDGPHGYDPTERLEKFVKDASGLDNLYIEILRHTFNEDDVEVMARFKRVLGSILTAKEPLCISAHSALQLVIEGKDDVRKIVQPLGSLLHGTAQSDTPILALHASFFDFLRDPKRSQSFFVDPTHLEPRFILACLGVMKNELRFNICHLPTSYVHNTEVPDMHDRAGRFISPHLLYACRFAGTHLEATPYEAQVSEELRVFLHEKLLFWLEVLSLTKQMSSATRVLTSIVNWNEKSDSDSDLAAFARDAIRFIDVFVPPISQSAPHIYLSALPFAPSTSLVSQMYLPRYPCTMRLKSGKLNQWPAELKKFEGHSHLVCSIAYSPDGTHIVSGSYDNTVRMWDAETGMVTVGPLKGHKGAVWCVTYSPDGKHVASGSEDETICVWDTETGEMVRSPFEGHTEAIYCIVYSPDGKYIASGSQDNMIRVWDAETGEAVGSPLEGHTNTVLCLAYSPDGQHIASASGDCTIRLWDGKTGKAVGLPLKGHSGPVWSLAYSPDGKFIASGSDDCTVRLWNAETGEAVGLPFEGHSKLVRSVAYFPDGKHIVSGSFDGTIRVWDGKMGHTVGEPLKGHGSWFWSVACSPDGTRIASGSEDCTIRVWDAEIIDREAVEVPLQKPLSSARVFSVAYSRDGASIASGDGNGVIQVWDAGTGKAVGVPLEGHRDLVRSIAYSPDGTCLVSGSSDKTIRRWDMETGKEVGSPLEGHSDQVQSVAYSPDGKCIVSGSDDKTIRIWNAATGEELMSIEDCKDKVWAMAYSPDGQCIVSGHSNGVIQVWNAVTGEAVGPPFDNTRGINAIAYSPDGTRIASGSHDCTIRVWDARTGKAIGSPLKGHSGPVRSVAYSADSKRIASGSDDGTVRVWDAETCVAFRAPFKVHVGEVMSVAFSPDGMHIVSGSMDTIRVWEVNSMTRTSESAIGFSHDSILDNGWIMTPSAQLLVWIPSWYHTGLVWPSNTAVIAASLTELDLSDFVHGSAWQQCRQALQIAP